MTVSSFDSQLFGKLFSDPELQPLFSDHHLLQLMITFEIALAKVEAELGIIPESAAREIKEKLESFSPDPVLMSSGTATHGVPVPGLLRLCREQLSEDAATYLHWAATSQDVLDTARILRIKQVIDKLKSKLESLVEHLTNLSKQHAHTVMLGRTRSQQATPTTFGYKVAGWKEPLARHLLRLRQFEPRLLVLSFGGSVGNLAVLGEKAERVHSLLAKELDLHPSVMAWHTQRDNLMELGNWLSMVTGSLGKLGQDAILLAQTEVGEIRFNTGGGSSTLPQKSNPIGAEVMVTLARFNAGLLATLHQSQLAEQERGGAAWMLEWLVLPQMIMATAAALTHASLLTNNMQVNQGRMRSNLEQSNGLVMAEAAVFALARFISRAEAEKRVKTACLQVIETGEHLIDILAQQESLPVDWDKLKHYETQTGLAASLSR